MPFQRRRHDKRALAREAEARCSSNRFLLLGCRSLACSWLGFGLRQEAEARLAPREINAYVQQGIGTPAGTGKFHDRKNAVGLPGSQGHWPASDMVRGGIDAQNKIAGADSVAHSFHPLFTKDTTFTLGQHLGRSLYLTGADIGCVGKVDRRLIPGGQHHRYVRIKYKDISHDSWRAYLIRNRRASETGTGFRSDALLPQRQRALAACHRPREARR